MEERALALYLPIVKAIMAHWWRDVGLSPGAVLLFVNERTYRYGKEVERIPERHFLHGIDAARTGEVVHGGLPMGKTTLWKSIDLLTERELLGVQRVKHEWKGSLYSLNVERILEPVVMSKLKESKQSRINPGVRRRRSQRLATGRKGARGGGDSDGAGRGKRDKKAELAGMYGASQATIEALLGADSAAHVVREANACCSGDEQRVVRETNNRSTEVNTDREERISSGAGHRAEVGDVQSYAEEVRQRVLQRRAEARERKAARRKNTSAMSAGHLREEWVHQFYKLTGEEYPWSITNTEAGMMRRNIKGLRLPKDGVPGLFAGAIVHWKAIKNDKLKWNNDVPREPDFAFCAKFIRYVARAVSEIEAAPAREEPATSVSDPRSSNPSAVHVTPWVRGQTDQPAPGDLHWDPEQSTYSVYDGAQWLRYESEEEDEPISPAEQPETEESAFVTRHDPVLGLDTTYEIRSRVDYIEDSTASPSSASLIRAGHTYEVISPAGTLRYDDFSIGATLHGDLLLAFQLHRSPQTWHAVVEALPDALSASAGQGLPRRVFLALRDAEELPPEDVEEKFQILRLIGMWALVDHFAWTPEEIERRVSVVHNWEPQTETSYVRLSCPRGQLHRQIEAVLNTL